MALVDHDEAKMVGRDALAEVAGRALDRREDVLPLLGHLTVDVELAEGAVAKDLAERGERLLENLAPMREEEEARPRVRPLARAGSRTPR